MSQLRPILLKQNRPDAEQHFTARTRSQYLGNGTLLCQVLGGLKLFVIGDDVGFSPHMIFEGYWEFWLTRHFAEVIRPGDTVLDIGANLGYYTLLAADLVGARKFIERLPGQLSYNVMERGSTLSVGQRQLISFIRAMVYNPKILVLDEATSSVDTETEHMIQNAIEKMMTGRTSIVIAHRLSTIQKADNIMVLDKGEIKESGNHENLLQKEGFYTQLYKMQYKEFV